MITLGGKTALQRLRTAAGMGPPITTFAALPSVGSVPGQLRQLSDAGNILVQSLGGIWRPYGGSQVLAMRILNPVTVQSLTAIRVETIGPFPGGLVRAGMRIKLEQRFKVPGIGTGTRRVMPNIGPVGHSDGASTQLEQATFTGSSTSYKGELVCGVDVLSDTSATHIGGAITKDGGISFLANGYASAAAPTSAPVVDFSQPWEVGLFMTSCAETAVNITGATWSAGVATYTCTAHTLSTGDKTVIAGISPAGWNVAAGAIATRIDNNTFSIPLAADPGAYVSGGTSSRISNMISQSYILTLEG